MNSPSRKVNSSKIKRPEGAYISKGLQNQHSRFTGSNTDIRVLNSPKVFLMTKNNVSDTQLQCQTNYIFFEHDPFIV